MARHYCNDNRWQWSVMWVCSSGLFLLHFIRIAPCSTEKATGVLRQWEARAHPRRSLSLGDAVFVLGQICRVFFCILRHFSQILCFDSTRVAFLNSISTWQMHYFILEGIGRLRALLYLSKRCAEILSCSIVLGGDTFATILMPFSHLFCPLLRPIFFLSRYETSSFLSEPQK